MTAVSEESAALDSVLRHHLSLDPATDSTTKEKFVVTNEISQDEKNSKLRKRISLKEFTDLPTGCFLSFCIKLDSLH